MHGENVVATTTHTSTEVLSQQIQISSTLNQLMYLEFDSDSSITNSIQALYQLYRVEKKLIGNFSQRSSFLNSVKTDLVKHLKKDTLRYQKLYLKEFGNFQRLLNDTRESEKNDEIKWLIGICCDMLAIILVTTKEVFEEANQFKRDFVGKN